MSEETIKRRAISVHRLDRATMEAKDLPRLLGNAPGVISARYDDKDAKLFVEYDLEETDYAHIDDLLERVGFVQEDTLWEHLKESFIRFIEENERAHFHAHADCCVYSPMEDIDDELEKG